MSARTSSASSVLIVILLFITFPLWIGLAAGLFGLVIGLGGACIGIIAGVFGAIFGVIGAIIGGIFGIFGNAFHWFSFPHLPAFKFFLIVALVFVIVMISKSRKK